MQSTPTALYSIPLVQNISNKYTKLSKIADDKHAPFRLRRVQSEYKPWFTIEIKRMSYNIDHYEKQSVKSGFLNLC